jgi:hypothetical protein
MARRQGAHPAGERSFRDRTRAARPILRRLFRGGWASFPGSSVVGFAVSLRPFAKISLPLQGAPGVPASRAAISCPSSQSIANGRSSIVDAGTRGPLGLGGGDDEQCPQRRSLYSLKSPKRCGPPNRTHPSALRCPTRSEKLNTRRNGRHADVAAVYCRYLPPMSTRVGQ